MRAKGERMTEQWYGVWGEARRLRGTLAWCGRAPPGAVADHEDGGRAHMCGPQRVRRRAIRFDRMVVRSAAVPRDVW